MKQTNITDFFNWGFYNDQKFHSIENCVFITTILYCKNGGRYKRLPLYVHCINKLIGSLFLNNDF